MTTKLEVKEKGVVHRLTSAADIPLFDKVMADFLEVVRDMLRCGHPVEIKLAIASQLHVNDDGHVVDVFHAGDIVTIDTFCGQPVTEAMIERVLPPAPGVTQIG